MTFFKTNHMSLELCVRSNKLFRKHLEHLNLIYEWQTAKKKSYSKLVAKIYFYLLQNKHYTTFEKYTFETGNLCILESLFIKLEKKKKMVK